MYFRHRSGSENYCLYSETVNGSSVESASDRADAAKDTEQQSTCNCGEPIVRRAGHWLHLYNPKLTGADDHMASPF